MEFLEQLLNVELGLPARFIIAFVTVLVLIGLTAWIVRRVASSRGGTVGSRARQQRLAVVDAAQIDAKRRLLLVRRDNTEHLILIGGPSDVVIESQISRGGAPAEQRDARTAQQPAAPPQRQPVREEPPIPPPPSRPAPSPQPAASPRPAPPPPQAPPLQSPVQRTAPQQRFPLPPEPAQGERPASYEPRVSTPPSPQPRQEPQVSRPSAPNPPPSEQAQAPDPKLQDMAQRLESALARPYSPPPPASAREGEQPPREEAIPSVHLYDEDKKQES